MPVFSQEELNLIYLYNPGNLKDLLYELRSMQCLLNPDGKELRNLTERTIRKVETLTRDSICFGFCDAISNDLKRHNVFLRSVIQ